MTEGLTPTDYLVFGVLCAAKFETGPQGARRAFLIGMRGCLSDEDVQNSLVALMDAGMIREQPRNDFGFVYFDALIAPARGTSAKPGSPS